MSVLNASLVAHLFNNEGNPCLRNVHLLQSVASNSNVLKIGVGIDQDMMELYRGWPEGGFATACGRLDIGGIGGRNGRTVSLKTLAKSVLGVELLKSRKIATSNWGQIPLTDRQIAYAARDAWASAAILCELAQRNQTLFSTQSLLNLVLKEEIPISELHFQAVDRRKVKDKYCKILGQGGGKLNRSLLTEEQLEELLSLEAIMSSKAPPKPHFFDISRLGFNLEV